MKKTLLFVILLSFSQINAQSIDHVSPNFGDAGQVVDVTITGTNSNFNSSGTFQFYQGSDYLDFPYNPTLVSATEANGNIDLTNFQTGTFTNPGGFFHLSYSQGSASFFSLSNAFFVNTGLGGSLTISGTIILGTPKALSEKGDPVIFGKLFLVNSTTQKVVAVDRTNSVGFFDFLNVPNGNYSLHIENFENVNPFPLTVDENTNTTDLSLQYKDDHILSIENDRLFKEKFDFNLYPTAFSSDLTLSMNLTEMKDIEIKVLDINGKLIVSHIEKNSIGNIKIDLSEKFTTAANGIYFIETKIDNKTLTSKLIKH